MTTIRKKSGTAGDQDLPVVLRPLSLTAVLAVSVAAALLPSNFSGLNFYLVATAVLMFSVVLTEWRRSALYAHRGIFVTVWMLVYIVVLTTLLPAYPATWLVFVPLANAAVHLRGRNFGYMLLLCFAALIYVQVSQTAAELNAVLAVIPQALIAVVITLAMRALVTGLSQLKQQQRVAVQQDPVTGLMTMSAFMQRLTLDHQQMADSDSGYALLMVDIDGLRQYNQQYGFEQGERVLAAVADAIKRSLRQTDYAARYGGDEFIVFVTPADAEIAQAAINAIMQNVYNISFSSGRRMHRIVVHTGMAVFPDSGKTVADMMNFADQAMYRDKDFRRRVSPSGGSAAGREQAGLDTR